MFVYHSEMKLTVTWFIIVCIIKCIFTDRHCHYFALDDSPDVYQNTSFVPYFFTRHSNCIGTLIGFELYAYYTGEYLHFRTLFSFS